MFTPSFLILRDKIKNATSLGELDRIAVSLNRQYSAGQLTVFELKKLDDLYIKKYESIKDREES